jgi:hypothetical protein
MQKAHFYEAILLVNRGVDEAVRGLERLKRAKDSQLNPSCFDQELVLFEDHRARLNSFFCSVLQQSELQDSARFGTRHRESEKNTLDEVHLYRDVRVREDRRRLVLHAGRATRLGTAVLKAGRRHSAAGR